MVRRLRVPFQGFAVVHRYMHIPVFFCPKPPGLDIGKSCSQEDYDYRRPGALRVQKGRNKGNFAVVGLTWGTH